MVQQMMRHSSMLYYLCMKYESIWLRKDDGENVLKCMNGQAIQLHTHKRLRERVGENLGVCGCKPRHHRRISNEFRLYATNHSKTRKRQGLKDREQIFNSRKRISISISFSITLTRSLSLSL